jgi:3-hydroxyacyl-[acyl-carrier-protein] dehydratase
VSTEPQGWLAHRSLSPDHPSLAGHFPGQPVYPGVVLLAEVLEAALAIPAIAARLGAAPRIDNVKFLAPVLPGATAIELQLRFTPRAAQGVDFELHHGPVLAVRGQLAG